jgi:hypothetical protein
MVTSKQCFDKWGDPLTTHDEGLYMVMWDVPKELEIGVIPKRLYCNKAIIAPLTQAFKNLIATGFVKELKTWDGCFNVRKKRGLASMSLHSWGVAIDVNAAWNGLGKTPVLSAGFVKCFTDAGFDWGGTWTRKDGMHFQLSKI